MIEPHEAQGQGQEHDDLVRSIEEVLDGVLLTRDAAVLRLRYGLVDGRVRTLREVGLQFGVTGSRIQQIEVKAIKRWRTYRLFEHLRRSQDIERLVADEALVEAILREKRRRHR